MKAVSRGFESDSAWVRVNLALGEGRSKRAHGV